MHFRFRLRHLGYPFVDSLEPRRLLTGEVGGRAFYDSNANCVFDGNDTPYANSTIYLDDDEDLFVDAAERRTVSDPQGQFVLNDVSPGEHRVRWTIPNEFMTPAILAPDYRGLLISVPEEGTNPALADLQLGFVSVTERWLPKAQALLV